MTEASPSDNNLSLGNDTRQETERTRGSAGGALDAAVSAPRREGPGSLLYPVPSSQNSAEVLKTNCGGVGITTVLPAKTVTYKLCGNPCLPESPFPSLVSISLNSRETRQREHTRRPSGAWLKGVCERHGNVHWRYVPCHRRDCPVCGEIGRYRIAEHISFGVREFGIENCAWLVLTFAEDIDKLTAVRKLARFVVKLRKLVGPLEYAATYELTRHGRLHINLIVAGWRYVPQTDLQELWGGVVWVSWIRDEGVGAEVAKAYTPESLGNYLSKLEQAVPDDRRVSFSRGWPKLPKNGLIRRGKITWHPDDENWLYCEQALERGYWQEFLPGEYCLSRDSAIVKVFDCLCFDINEHLKQ